MTRQIRFVRLLTLTLPWVAACAQPPAPQPSTSEARTGEISPQEIVDGTVDALASGPHAFAVVQRAGDEVLRGRLFVAPVESGNIRFLLEWDGDPPKRVASDGRVVYATTPEGTVLTSAIDRAGTVLRGREAGKLVPTAVNPASFAQYGAEILPAEDGVMLLRAALPNGGGWELAVSSSSGLPRRVSFQSSPDAPAEVLELTPIDAAVPTTDEAFQLEPREGAERLEFFAGPALGETPPATTFQLADGTSIELEDLRGSAVVLDFWATWCVPCRPAMAELEELHRELAADGLEVFGLRLFDSGDPAAFLDSLGVTYRIGDGQPFVDSLAVGTYGLPTLYVLDREGRIVDFLVGFDKELSPPRLRQAVVKALGSA